MNRFNKILLYLILVIQLIINILIANKLITIYQSYSTLEERVNNIAISNRLNYEDLLEKIEINDSVKRGVY